MTAMSASGAYENTHRKVAEAREKRLAELAAENAALIATLTDLVDALQKIADNPFSDPEGNSEFARKALEQAGAYR